MRKMPSTEGLGSAPALVGESNRRNAFPHAAASAAIFRDGDVLLIERGQGALKGLWSLPGGHIELGERARDAARREVAEETGITADIRAFLDLHEVILKTDDGDVSGHYLIAVFAGVWLSGEPEAGGDAAAAAFFPLSALDQLSLTPGAAAFARRAHELLLSL